jgi:hypothetical protein
MRHKLSYIIGMVTYTAALMMGLLTTRAWMGLSRLQAALEWKTPHKGTKAEASNLAVELSGTIAMPMNARWASSL